MQQNSKNCKQVKGFATAQVCGQNRHTPDGLRTIGTPDFQVEKMQSTVETDRRKNLYP